MKEEGREWKPHLLFPSNCLALKSFIEFFPCCVCCCFIVHFRTNVHFGYFFYFFYYFMNIAKSSSTSNRLIKHLIKYRYKSNIFFYFHKFFSIIFVIKKTLLIEDICITFSSSCAFDCVLFIDLE